MRPVLDPAILRPGDVIIHRPFEPLGWVIAVRTGRWYGHVEVVEVPGTSTLTARADRGVNRYPWDWPRPGMALKPPPAFSWPKALAYFRMVQGQPYAAWALLTFIAPNPQTIEGQQFCSQFATNMYRAGGLTPFGEQPAARVALGAFTRAEGFTVVWSDD